MSFRCPHEWGQQLIYTRLNGLVGDTPTGSRSVNKRKSTFETPKHKAAKTLGRQSPTSEIGSALGAPATATPFHSRPQPGQLVETINERIPSAAEQTDRAVALSQSGEPRVKLKSNTEIAKFNYRPMAMKLTEASEVLDDRLDEFAQLVQEHHELSDAAFGNPAAQGTSEIVTVGRIASDADRKLTSASLVLETSRRMGAGMRIPLRLAENVNCDFFPGKIVAVRGTNPAGEYFTVTEVLAVPLMHLAAVSIGEVEATNLRLQGPDGQTQPLSVMVASGPYTPDTDLSFAAFNALLDRAAEISADVLILNGPFLDLQHPLVATGDFDLPADYPVSPDRATLTDAFGAFISRPLTKLLEQHPSMTVLIIPSVRDAISKHVSWPQDKLPRKDLGLPKGVTCVPNPIILSLNDIVLGISSQDVLTEMQRQSVTVGKNRATDVLARFAEQVIEQRHFFPVFPPSAPEALPRPTSLAIDDPSPPLAVGACLDVPYLKLGEFVKVRPDLLITPSMLTPFAKVVESVVVVNPGELSKKRAAGTYAHLTIMPRVISDEERDRGGVLGQELFDRARVDIVRI